MSDATVEQYLARARALYEAQGHFPESEALRELALELGMTEAESEAADVRARELTEQAYARLEAREREEAEALAVDAALLSPVRVEPLALLARIERDRWRKSGDAASAERGRVLCERILALDPEHGGALPMSRELRGAAKASLSWKRALVVVAALVTVSFAITSLARCIVPPRPGAEGADMAGVESLAPTVPVLEGEVRGGDVR